MKDEQRVEKLTSAWTGIGIGLMSTFVMISLPLLLVMINVRLVMSKAFLELEYTRPGFPIDVYGLTTEERLRYAPYAVEYLLNGEDISYLGDLRFSDGTPLFNTRELRHMYDVKVLTQIAYGVAIAVGILSLAFSYVLWRRQLLRVALLRGAILTLAIIFSIVLVAMLNWDFFFTGFHTLFFEGDTWYFAYSDTLIRLFPEQFWFDAALVIGVLTAFEALLVTLVTLYRRQPSF